MSFWAMPGCLCRYVRSTSRTISLLSSFSSNSHYKTNSTLDKESIPGDSASVTPEVGGSTCDSVCVA